MEFKNETKTLYKALLEKTEKDTDRIGAFIEKMGTLNDKFKTPERQEEWRQTSHELSVYHSRYIDAKQEQDNALMESALRQQKLEENPDETLASYQAEYDDLLLKFEDKRAKGEERTPEEMEKFRELGRKIDLREMELYNEVNNTGGMFDFLAPVRHAAASSIVNSVIGVADLVTAGQFPELQETMKELGMPYLNLDKDGMPIEDSDYNKNLYTAASIMGALALPAGEAKIVANSIGGARKLENYGTRVAMAATAGVANYGSALALTVGDDHPEASAGFAGALASSLGFGGKIGWLLAGGSAGGMVAEAIDSDTTGGIAAGLAAGGAAIATRGAYKRINPNVTQLIRDAEDVFNLTKEELTDIQLKAIKLFDVEDVTKLTKEQKLVSIFNSNPNAKAMMHRAILDSEKTKSKINHVQQEISNSLKNMVSSGNPEEAIAALNSAKDSHKALKSELKDLVSGSGYNIKIDLSQTIDDFKYAFALKPNELKTLDKFADEGLATSEDMLDLRQLLSDHVKVNSQNVLDKKIAIKVENVLAKIDNQVAHHFDEEQQALYFLNNRTQAQLRTLEQKGQGLGDFLNPRLPQEKRYRALQDVMKSEQQYSNLLKVFEGEPDMMRAFEDVVLNKIFTDSSKEGVLDFVKLSGEIEKLPWKDLKLSENTYSYGAGEVLESRGPAIKEVVELFKDNYRNVKFTGGAADEFEKVGVRIDPRAMAAATALTRVYHSIAKLWSSESRLIGKLPKYLREQQIPANVSIEDNIAVFDIMKTLHKDLKPGWAPVEGIATRQYSDKIEAGKEARVDREMNYLLPADKRSDTRSMFNRRGPKQDINVGGNSTEKIAGWVMKENSIAPSSEPVKAAAFVLKEKHVNFKLGLGELTKSGGAKLSDLIDSKVFNVYPDLKNIRVKITNDDTSFAGIGENSISISAKHLEDQKFVWRRLADVLVESGVSEEEAVARVKAAYRMPATLEGRFRLVLNHELQHFITRKAFPKTSADAGVPHDGQMDERISELTRVMKGEDVKNVKIQSVLDSQDATRGENGYLY